jgi:hypothetical protein
MWAAGFVNRCPRLGEICCLPLCYSILKIEGICRFTTLHQTYEMRQPRIHEMYSGSYETCLERDVMKRGWRETHVARCVNVSCRAKRETGRQSTRPTVHILQIGGGRVISIRSHTIRVSFSLMPL